jgi:hypothetical protein
VTERVLSEWRRRVAAEYRSAALAAQVSHWMIQCGLDEALIHTALRIVRDELDHASLSHDCLLALGGEDRPSQIEIGHLAEPVRAGVLPDLVTSVTRNFCLGETLAVPLFHAMRRHTTHPEARAALTRILKDESVHRAFGWDTLDALLRLDENGVRERVSAQLPVMIADFERSYARAPEDSRLLDSERSAGLLSLAEYSQVFRDTIQGDIRRRFAARGIAIRVNHSVS